MTRRAGALGGLVALLVLSLWLRTRALDGGLWIDEAISRGIATHELAEIPAVLRRDGSPPLYYLLLHGVIELFGDGEAALRALSLLAALLTIPAAFWAGGVAAGPRAAWIAAALAALNPFLTIYAQEARMYSLVALLSVLACGSFTRGFVDGDRPQRALFAVLLAALLYTHAWAIFLGIGLGAAGAVQLRDRLRELVAPFAAAALLYLPWVPTLIYQARHTGAPWSSTPSLLSLLGGIPGALDGGVGAAAVVAVGAVGLLRARRESRVLRVAGLLALIALVALGAAWAHSQLSPSWANRYLAIVVGPVLLVGAAGLSRAGRLGVVTTAVVSLLWLGFAADPDKSNARSVVAAAGALPAGTLVASAQPEQGPLLAYYLRAGPRFATPLGLSDDPRLMDWRDALPRLRAARGQTLSSQIGTLRRGQLLVLVLPLVGERGWHAPWQREVRRIAATWGAVAARDERLRFVRTVRTPRVQRSRTDIELRIFRRV